MCDVCRKTCINAGVLERLKLIHTSHKPFVCGVCSKASTLKSHKKIHTNPEILFCVRYVFLKLPDVNGVTDFCHSKVTVMIIDYHQSNRCTGTTDKKTAPTISTSTNLLPAFQNQLHFFLNPSDQNFSCGCNTVFLLWYMY